ncbi:MAG: IclR family transcriptional regulator [Edaphobacter sp.]|jgi:DNA-binding IclR family transcriptional regulator|nr:IclR family transcriptional regulator [Edaphobacter sp.]
MNSVERAFAILEFLNSSRRGWNISEMSRKLGLPKSSTHVLFATLDKLGYITEYQSSRRYQLSPKLYGLGRRALETTPLPMIALPHLHWLVQQTNLTAHVGILEKKQVVFVQKVDGPGIIKFDTYIGKCSQLHCTGLGKSLVAFRPEEEIKSLLDRYTFSRFTKQTISSLSTFITECERIRHAGYSMDDEEEELGIRCVAVPVLSDGFAVAAVSVTGTTAQMPLEAIANIVSKTICAARRIAAQLQPARARHHISEEAQEGVS